MCKTFNKFVNVFGGVKTQMTLMSNDKNKKITMLKCLLTQIVLTIIKHFKPHPYRKIYCLV